MFGSVLLALVALTASEAELKAKLPEIFAKSAAHYLAIDAAARPLQVSPVELTEGRAKTKLLFPHGYRRAEKRLDMRNIHWWTSGHFPGALWYIYEGTGDAKVKAAALYWNERLAPNSTADSNHDLGFIMNCSYGNARRLLKTDRYDALLLETAKTLGRRYHRKLGLIRSWGKIDDDKNFLVIPDNMMNLELLELASKIGGGSAYDDMARSHADKSMVHHFRSDYSCRHVLNYDQQTRRVKSIDRGQGASAETAWSRGQSWGIYGYTMMYRMTRKREYLRFACRLADYAIDHPNMPADGVPYWDYGAPGEERDTSAASCMAAGLVELATFLGPTEGAKYRNFAVKQLLSLASPEYFSEGDEIGHFLLKHGVGNKPGGGEIDTPLVYGDYYFLEALIRFRNTLDFEGPVTTAKELLTQHLDTSSPLLAEAERAAQAGDLAAGERLLADFIRQEPTLSRLEAKLRADPPSAATMRTLKADAERIMSFKLRAVNFTYDFSSNGVDWVMNPTRGSYQEWPWQLSRHHDLALLAKYYFYTHDERAAQVWTQLLGSWFYQAKFPFEGATDASRACWRTLDAGIRMHNWNLQLAVFRHSPNVSAHFLTRMARSFYEHARYLRFEHQPDIGNWVMHEMVGQTKLLLFERFLKERKEWLADAEAVLKRQYESQIYPDGWQVELSTDYQTSVLDSGFVGVMKYYRDAGEQPPKYALEGIDKSYRVYIHLRRPDGRSAPVNDGDEANVQSMCQRALSVYPDDPEFLYFATEGKRGRAPNYLSAASEYSGYITFRTDWGPSAVWGFFDAGDDFFRGWHMHDDALNFTLSAYGKNMLVEPGNYRYDKSAMRQYAITSPSHNTILIDGLGQCRKLTYRAADFSLKRKPAFDFRAGPKFDFARHAYQDGYGKLQLKDVRHQRTVWFVKDFAGLKPFFAIVDELSAKPGKHDFDILWHLNVGATARISGNRFVGDFGKGITLTGVSSDAAAYVDMKGSLDPFQGWSPVWSEDPVEKHNPIATPVQKGSFDGFKRIVTIMQPNERNAESPIVAVTAGDSDTAFTLKLKDGSTLPFSGK